MTAERAGYGDAQNLLGPASLYDTSWSIQLARYASLNIPPRLDKTRVAQEFRSIIRSGKSAGLSPAGDTATTLALSLEGLAALDPRSIISGDPFARLLSGNAFAPDPGDAPTLSATFTAIQGLHASGSSVPSSVVMGMEGYLSRLTGNASPQAIQATDVPVLLSLGLSLSKRGFRREAPNADTWVADWERTIIATGSGPVQLSALDWIWDLHEAQGTPWVTPSASYTATLATSSGFYGLGHDSPDPQVTFYAAQIGQQLSSRKISEALKTRLEPQGWIDAFTSASLQSTFEATVVDQICQIPLHPLVAPVRDWLKSAALSVATPSAVYESCAIADAYGTPIAGPDKRTVSIRLAHEVKVNRPGFRAAFFLVKGCVLCLRNSLPRFTTGPCGWSLIV